MIEARVRGRDWVRGAVLGLAGAMLLAGPTMAAEPMGRLRLEVMVEGHESWKRNGDWRKAEIKERYVTDIPVTGSDDLDPHDMLDPDYASRVQEHAARVMERQRQLAARHGQAAQGGMAAMMGDPAAMMAMQKQAEACRGDQACLQKLAMDFMSRNTTGQQAQVMAEIQAACGQHTGKALEACMEKMGRERSRPLAGAQADELPELEDPEGRFRRYNSSAECDAQAEVSISRVGKGQMADVAGMYDTSDSVKGSGKVTGAPLSMLCLATELVVDVPARTFTIRAWAPPTVEAETRTHQPPDRPLEGRHITGPLPGVAEWVGEVLRNAPFSGTRTTTLTAAQTHPQGPPANNSDRALKVTLSWSFSPGK